MWRPIAARIFSCQRTPLLLLVLGSFARLQFGGRAHTSKNTRSEDVTVRFINSVTTGFLLSVLPRASRHLTCTPSSSEVQLEEILKPAVSMDSTIYLGVQFYAAEKALASSI